MNEGQVSSIVTRLRFCLPLSRMIVDSRRAPIAANGNFAGQWHYMWMVSDDANENLFKLIDLMIVESRHAPIVDGKAILMRWRHPCNDLPLLKNWQGAWNCFMRRERPLCVCIVPPNGTALSTQGIIAKFNVCIAVHFSWVLWGCPLCCWCRKHRSWLYRFQAQRTTALFQGWKNETKWTNLCISAKHIRWRITLCRTLEPSSKTIQHS